MPSKKTIQKARKKRQEGKSPSTQAGEFVREEIKHIRQGKHGARSTKQAIAIGLSKARKAGIPLPQPEGIKKGKKGPKKFSPKRSKAIKEVLKKEPKVAASHKNLSNHAKQSARARGSKALHNSAKKAARTRARKKNHSKKLT